MDGSSAKLNKAIVILTPGFAANESDTTCIPALQDYVATLHQNHPEFKLFVLSFQYPFKRRWYKWNGIDVYSAGGKNSKYFFKFRTWFRIYREMKRIHKKYGIDTIHSFWLTEAALIAQYFASRKKIRHIATLFGQDALPANRYLKILNLNKFIIVGNSDFVSKKLKESTGRQANCIIHFGLSEDILSLNASSKRLYDIIGVGSLIKLKNYDLFVRMVEEVKRAFPLIRTIIVGEGVERKKLQSLIAKLNLENNIELTGSLPRNKAINLMGQSKILLHASGYESAGYIFLEALSSGCQVVSFEVGYAPISGKVHRFGNSDEMVGKIKSLLGSTLEFNKEIVPSMNDTVQKFVKLYLE
jgi:glycosyltransferase involved in cell wall biosynthesis